MKANRTGFYVLSALVLGFACREVVEAADTATPTAYATSPTTITTYAAVDCLRWEMRADFFAYEADYSVAPSLLPAGGWQPYGHEAFFVDDTYLVFSRRCAD